MSEKELEKRGFKFFKLLVFFSFVGDQTQTSARPSLDRDFESRNLIHQNLLKHQHTKLLHTLCFFFVCEIYFLLVLSKRSIRNKRTCQNVQGYCVIGTEITTVLKIAVGSVTPELCDSRDYFASSLLVKKTE